MCYGLKRRGMAQMPQSEDSGQRGQMRIYQVWSLHEMHGQQVYLSKRARANAEGWGEVYCKLMVAYT